MDFGNCCHDVNYFQHCFIYRLEVLWCWNSYSEGVRASDLQLRVLRESSAAVSHGHIHCPVYQDSWHHEETPLRFIQDQTAEELLPWCCEANEPHPCPNLVTSFGTCDCDSRTKWEVLFHEICLFFPSDLKNCAALFITSVYFQTPWLFFVKLIHFQL